jgi:uncharacterized membrane protein YqjE
MDDNPTGAGATSSARFDRAEDRPIGELVRDLSQQTSTLVRQELELARAELQQKGKIAGVGAGMFGAAGLLGFFAFAALTTAIIAALSLVFDEIWPAALIVAAVYGAIAGVLALTGKNKVREATPPVERTPESVKQDIASVKAHAQAGREHGHA